jgi:uncharacterized protein YbjT (DUF2867 family)
VENYLKSSGLPNAILRPCAFFENLDDPVNYNPLKKGHLKFLTLCKLKFCATLDIGKAAAVIFSNPDHWNGRTLDVQSWEGSVADCAAALERVCKLLIFLLIFVLTIV